MIDGFFTRPPLLRALLGTIAPNPRHIQELLARGGESALDALFVAHSHYDHVMDSPEVVKQIGTLYGSESSLNLGRGANLGEERMSVIGDGGQFNVGDVTVQVIEGNHCPGYRYPGTIDTPLATPTKASNYRDGNCYSFHITHPTGTVLVHPSANFVPNKFTGLDVDVLYLGVGILGTQSEQFREDYWRHVVTSTSPSRIVPVHWDHFGQPLSRNLRALPPVFDKFSVMKAFMERRCAQEGIPLTVQKAFETVDLFMPPVRPSSV